MEEKEKRKGKMKCCIAMHRFITLGCFIVKRRRKHIVVVVSAGKAPQFLFVNGPVYPEVPLG